MDAEVLGSSSNEALSELSWQNKRARHAEVSGSALQAEEM
jgi:hypothetical protein